MLEICYQYIYIQKYLSTEIRDFYTHVRLAFELSNRLLFECQFI